VDPQHTFDSSYSRAYLEGFPGVPETPSEI